MRKRSVDLVAGGPPCQPFSKAGFWHRGETRRMMDPRAEPLVRYFAIVDAVLPRVVLLENVAGLVYRGMDEGWQYCVAAFKRINRKNKTNYRPTLVQLNAADFGVPQLRQRVFVIAERSGKRFSLPAPTHSAEASKGTLRYATAWDAIGSFKPSNDATLEVQGKWASLLSSIPEGENYLWHTDRGGGIPIFGWRTRYWSFLLKLAKNQPAWTIQAQAGPATGPFHWEHRRLDIQELLRLQTFPRGVRVVGSDSSIRRQLGNAVPSAIGELLGLEIRRQFFGERVRRRLRLIPKLRNDCPRAHPRRPVPLAFSRMARTHAAHPGHGLGPGAVRWRAISSQTSNRRKKRMPRREAR
jgi:DNA (cytosine-5)-methyltransferase 1